jgi:predicted nuclease of predicted toxin-antitoxin system
MRLLFDEHLSQKLGDLLSDIFPDSKHVKYVDLTSEDDRKIWEYARRNQFVSVSKDSDFIHIASLLGHPPFLIWIRSGYVRVRDIESKLRSKAIEILNLLGQGEFGIIQVY